MSRFRVLILLIIVSFSCNVNNRKGMLVVRLYPCIYYDSLSSNNVCIICQEIENKSDVNLYTFQPNIVVYNAKYAFNYPSFYNELRSEGLGMGKYNQYNFKTFYDIDSITKSGLNENSNAPTYNTYPSVNKILDSFISYRYKRMGRKYDSLDASFQKKTWLFINAHTRTRKYYILNIENAYQDNVLALKIRNIHPNEQNDYRIKNENKFPMPSSFSGYELYSKTLSADSLTIPIIK